MCVVYGISVLSVVENKPEVWLIVFKASSFSVISAHERLFVGLVGGIGCVYREKYSEISVQEVCRGMPVGTSPVRGDRTAPGRGRSCCEAVATEASAQSSRGCGAGKALQRCFSPPPPLKGAVKGARALHQGPNDQPTDAGCLCDGAKSISADNCQPPTLPRSGRMGTLVLKGESGQPTTASPIFSISDAALLAGVTHTRNCETVTFSILFPCMKKLVEKCLSISCRYDICFKLTSDICILL